MPVPFKIQPISNLILKENTNDSLKVTCIYGIF